MYLKVNNCITKSQTVCNHIGNAYWLTPWGGCPRVLINTTFQCLWCTVESDFDPCLCTFSRFSISLQNTFVSGCLDRLESASMCCLNNPTNVGQHWSRHPQNLPPQKRDWVKSTETHADADDWHSCDISTENRLVSGVGDNNSGAGKKDSQCRLCTIGGRHQPLFGNIFVISNHTNGGGHV